MRRQNRLLADFRHGNEGRHENAVNQVYRLLRLKADDPEGYERQIAYGERCTLSWDDPE